MGKCFQRWIQLREINIVHASLVRPPDCNSSTTNIRLRLSCPHNLEPPTPRPPSTLSSIHTYSHSHQTRPILEKEGPQHTQKNGEACTGMQRHRKEETHLTAASILRACTPLFTHMSLRLCVVITNVQMPAHPCRATTPTNFSQETVAEPQPQCLSVSHYPSRCEERIPEPCGHWPWAVTYFHLDQHKWEEL